ncbi:MAG: division/cell wall cluster transcriptional repressor MraZ [Synergistetes bacterium]|nr:division/cell wall cluster transcriptional repressor MraZ [Synergistota bacterium]MCX8127791.1 division/cell wall cluster transcriptional repressor MraZ [Synergistota bacterium]MDW8192053.1 division/cell wall cluster transcriptional repressor MraZ [Synergistota bacterium]
MKTFVGAYFFSVDNKGRVFIPASMREKLGKEAVLTRGLDRCLFLFPLEEWEGIVNSFNSLSFAKKEVRAFLRLLLAGASMVSIDAQGRIQIPLTLREYAKLEKEVAIIGVGNRVEIWAKDRWDVYENDVLPRFEEVAEEIF